MTIAIVYRKRGSKEQHTVAFTGTHAERDGFRFIAYGQPMEIIAIRHQVERVDADEVEDLSYHEQEH